MCVEIKNVCLHSVLSWRSVLLVEKIGESHRTIASHCQSLSHDVVSGFKLTTLLVINTDCTCSVHPTSIRPGPRTNYFIFELKTILSFTFKSN